MTYITAHLPKVEDLKKELESNPDKIRIYMKYMGFEGPEGSIDYLTNQIEEYIKLKKTNK
jgi:hypothetical protein